MLVLKIISFLETIIYIFCLLLEVEEINSSITSEQKLYSFGAQFIIEAKLLNAAYGGCKHRKTDKTRGDVTSVCMCLQSLCAYHIFGLLKKY